MVQSSRHYIGYGPQSDTAENLASWENEHGSAYNHHLPESNFQSPYIPQDENFPLPTSSSVEGPAQWLDTEFFTPISPTTTSALPAQHRSSSASTAQSPYPGMAQSELDPDDPANFAIEEDKRRRNTAASARFRQKKKEREADLERRANQMTDRCDELQKRIGALETENRWLRELITERSRNRGRRGGRGMALNTMGRGKGKAVVLPTKKEKDILGEDEVEADRAKTEA